MAAPYLAIGAIFRRENRYLREWIEFHRLVGVERFYLLNHDASEELSQSEALLQPYVDSGILHTGRFNPPRRLLDIGRGTIVQRAIQDGVTWLAILDIDEFLMPTRGGDLPAVIRQYESEKIAGVEVRRLCYGSAGLEYPPMLQTEAFTRRAADTHTANDTWKCVMRLANILAYGTSKPGKQLIDEQRNPRRSATRGTTDLLRVNHYATRSTADWEAGHGRPLAVDYRLREEDQEDIHKARWTLLDRNEVFDAAAHIWLPQLKLALGLGKS